MTAEPLLVLAAAAACALLVLPAPAVLRRLPEPAPPPPEEVDTPDGPGVDGPPLAAAGPKETYAAIADLPRLRAGLVVAAALVGAVLAAAVGVRWSLVVLLVLVPPGVLLAVVDWRTRFLPTRLIAPTYGVLVPVVLLGWPVTGRLDGITGAAAGWAVAGGLYLLLWVVSPRSLGYGDVRLSGLLGIALGHLGWGPLLLGLWLGFLVGGVSGLVLSRGRVRRATYPFGPFMLLGAVLGVLCSPLVVPALG